MLGGFFLNSNVHVSTDDSGVFSTTLSNEYRIAYKAGVDRDVLIQSNMKSIQHAFCPNEVKLTVAKQLAKWYAKISKETKSKDTQI